MTIRRRTFWRAGLVFYVSGLAACRREDVPPATVMPTPTAGASTASAHPVETATTSASVASPSAPASVAATAVASASAIPAVASPRLAASPVAGVTAPPPQCALTPSVNSASVSEIGTPPVRSSVGQGHVLSGTVRSLRYCTPLAGASVILWLADPDGKYTPAYEATVQTDANGVYRFESTYPGTYEGTRPHIHMFVAADGHAGIETIYHPPSGSQAGTYNIVLAVK